MTPCLHPHMNSEPIGGMWGRWFTIRWTSNTRLDKKVTGHHHCQPPRYHRWNIWKLFPPAFIPHLMVAFCDFLLFWLPHVLLGSRIHFCKARKLGFLSYPFCWHFFRQLLRSAWCVCGPSTKKPWCRRFIDCVKQLSSLCSETALMPRFPTSCRTGSLGESPILHGYRKSVCHWENVSV